MNNLKNLTVIIVTYRTSKKIIEDNIKSIDKNVKILDFNEIIKILKKKNVKRIFVKVSEKEN